MNGLQHPDVTLFTDQQMSVIKRFCCIETGAVSGIGKTYKPGDFHVTPTVYKDLSNLRRSTREHPIYFGQTFIQTSSTTRTCSTFFYDIADRLTDTEISELTIGSDEESSCWWFWV